MNPSHGLLHQLPEFYGSTPLPLFTYGGKQGQTALWQLLQHGNVHQNPVLLKSNTEKHGESFRYSKNSRFRRKATQNRQVGFSSPDAFQSKEKQKKNNQQKANKAPNKPEVKLRHWTNCSHKVTTHACCLQLNPGTHEGTSPVMLEEGQWDKPIASLYISPTGQTKLALLDKTTEYKEKTKKKTTL